MSPVGSDPDPGQQGWKQLREPDHEPTHLWKWGADHVAHWWSVVDKSKLGKKTPVSEQPMNVIICGPCRKLPSKVKPFYKEIWTFLPALGWLEDWAGSSGRHGECHLKIQPWVLASLEMGNLNLSRREMAFTWEMWHFHLPCKDNAVVKSSFFYWKVIPGSF